jgi:hypothetical protein
MHDWCSHGHHDGLCGFKYVEIVRDDVGIFAPPTGIWRDILVGVCQCQGDHD